MTRAGWVEPPATSSRPAQPQHASTARIPPASTNDRAKIGSRGRRCAARARLAQVPDRRRGWENYPDQTGFGSAGDQPGGACQGRAGEARADLDRACLSLRGRGSPRPSRRESRDSAALRAPVMAPPGFCGSAGENVAFRPRPCENSTHRAAVYEFQSVFGRFRPLQGRRSAKIRSRCAVFRQFPSFHPVWTRS
jgi:hypothetical protein